MRKIMKYLVILLLPLFVIEAYSQISIPKPVYVYTYDNAGNRVRFERKEVILKTPVIVDTNIADIRISVTPNPAVDFIKVDFEGTTKDNNIKVELFDLNSNRIYFSQENTSELSIDLTGKASGFYLLNVYIDDKPTYWKIVKE
jgi:hypothetical protein